MKISPGDIVAARIKVQACSTCELKKMPDFHPFDCLSCDEGSYEWRPAICLANGNDNVYKVAVIGDRKLETYCYVGIASIRPVVEMFDSWSTLEKYGFRTACALKEVE